MKMYGYVSKRPTKSLYVREDHHALTVMKNLLLKRLGITGEEADEYIKMHYDAVEIEYNEVT